MLAKELINRLERLELLDREIIEALRGQLAEGGARVTPEAVAKLLVDNGQLTHYQASKLIGELRSGQYQESTATDAAEDLGFADEDSGAVDAVDIFESDSSNPVHAVPIVVDDDDSSQDVIAERPQTRIRKPDPQRSVWDSFKVYGYLGIIAMLLLVGGSIAWLLMRENADEVIENANNLYKQQNYDAAQKAYLDFAEDFPDSQHRSLADVRVVMTELYKAAAFKQEPWQAVDLAKQRLPAIANEQGMNDERGNLAQLLVEIAANLAAAAARTPETAQKQSLLAKLDEHRELMNDPLYVTGTMRTNLASQIQAVDEARARVQRDINRSTQLDAATASMKTLLEKQETRPAYQIRKDLLKEFPDLHNHERLVALIRQAGEIQQTLVEPSSKLPEISTESPPSKSLKTIVLTTLAGQPAGDLRGESYYLRAGGSILAFDAESGKLRWRRWVGMADDLPPVRMTGQDGVLLNDSSNWEVMRCGSEDGQIEWRAKLDEAYSLPIAIDDDVYISTHSGRLVVLDADRGQPRWAAQIPQPLETGPGIDQRAGRIYLPGNHSNLYLLDRADGRCLQSFYLGHDEGTIAVPPVPLLGHLFVCENAGANYTTVHVLKVDADSGQLSVAQPPFRMTGNVHIPPVIQGRRLIVLTDRGEGVVYDIEPTAEREQVSVAANLSASYDRPTATQMAVSGTQMWITGTRIGRYELQINTGNIVNAWTLHDADTFIGQPFAQGDTLLHARILRDTSAIRVTAAEAKTGNEIWHTDVGVPVAMIRQAPDGKDVDVVTSQAALYRLDRQALTSGSTKGPIENPGDQIIAKSFADPIEMPNGRVAMLNQVDGRSMLVYDPNREREQLRAVSMNLSAGSPSGGGLAVKENVMVPLDIGRVELIDSRTGASIATPFQPESDPTSTVVWTNPVALPSDGEQVVIANDRKRMYRLRVAEQITDLASKELEYTLLGTAAGIGETWISATAGPSADFLVGFEMTSLNEKFKNLLAGRIVWGPVASGELCLLQTDDGNLRAFDAEGKQKLDLTLPSGEPIGQPVMAGGSIVLAGKTGWLVAIDPSSGKLVGQTDLEQPLSASPFPIANTLLVPGQEGVIYIVKVPTE
jgi:outer membrane protein assembly factor BamB